MVSCLGRSGGISILWKDTISVDVKKNSSKYIDTKVKEGTNGPWCATIFYGFSKRARCR